MTLIYILLIGILASCATQMKPPTNIHLVSKDNKQIQKISSEFEPASFNDVRNPAGQIKRPQYGYKLVWSDEFNGAQEAIRNGEEPACFDSKPLLCKRNYWWVTECNKEMKDPRNNVTILDPSNTADLNKCVWNVYHGGHSAGGDYVSSWNANMVEVKDGYLILKNRKNYRTDIADYDCGKETIDQDLPYEWAKHVSQNCHFLKGAVDSKPNGSMQRGFSTKYGRVEVRAKLPDSPGSWPAHWMMPGDDNAPPEQYRGWPEAGEIDIMEMWMHKHDEVVGTYHNGDQLTGTHYWKGRGWKARKKYYPHLKSAKARKDTFINDFHTYAVEWEQDEIRFYVDNYLINRIVEGETVNKRINKGYIGRYKIPEWPFHIILNNQITNVGDNKKFWPTLENWKDSDHLIDYVRVYQACAENDQNCEFFNDTYRSKNKCPATMKTVGKYIDGTPICKNFAAIKIKESKCIAKGHFTYEGNCLINQNGKYFKARPLKDKDNACPKGKSHEGNYVDGMAICKSKYVQTYTKRKCNAKGGISYLQMCLRNHKNKYYKVNPLKEEDNMTCKWGREKLGERDGMPVCKVVDKIKRNKCEKKRGKFFTPDGSSTEYCIFREMDFYKAKKIK